VEDLNADSLVANDDLFLNHALKFMSETGLIIEATRLVPAFLAPSVSPYHTLSCDFMSDIFVRVVTKMMKRGNANQKHLFGVLARLIEQRRAYREGTSEQDRKPPVWPHQELLCRDLSLRLSFSKPS
jgi:hypothetical protein